MDGYRDGSLHNGYRIVVEHGRNVFRRKLVRGVRDQETGLADCTIADNYTPRAVVVSSCPI